MAEPEESFDIVIVGSGGRGMMQHLIVFVCAEREGALAERRP